MRAWPGTLGVWRCTSVNSKWENTFLLLRKFTPGERRVHISAKQDEQLHDSTTMEVVYATPFGTSILKSLAHTNASVINVISNYFKEGHVSAHKWTYYKFKIGEKIIGHKGGRHKFDRLTHMLQLEIIPTPPPAIPAEDEPEDEPEVVDAEPNEVIDVSADGVAPLDTNRPLPILGSKCSIAAIIECS